MRHTNRVIAAALAGIIAAAPVVPAQTQSREFTVVAGSAPRDPTNTLPLKTTRIARFTTDEGSWMSLSLSPDGRTILFDLLGDLYTLPIAGGKATRIMGGNQLDVQPAYSPDGKMIAFISDRSGSDQLWIANADGSNPVRLSKIETGRQGVGSFPVWTPDGQYIQVGATLFHLAGGAGATMPYGGVISFSPDGKRAYSSGGRGGLITVYDRATGKSHTAVSAPGGAMQGVLSPDGKKLAYFTRYDSRTALMVRDLDSGDERLLKIDVQHDASQRSAGFGAMPSPVWLKDGSAILTTYGGKIWKIDVGSGKSTMIPFTADVEQYLGPLSRFRYPITDTFTVRQIRDAVPSPDVKRLAFTALDKLYLTNLSGGTATPTRVTTAVNVVEHSPTWSPDGKYVVFATWTDDAGGDLYRVNADGSGLRKLTTTSLYYVRPAYSPDGRRIVFGMGPWVPRRNLADRLSGTLDDAPLTLAWMNADGGEVHEIVEVSTVGASLPDGPLAHFGPDSSRVLFYGTGGGIPAPAPGGGRGGGGGGAGAGLQSVRWDGSDRRALFAGDPITLSPTGAYGFAVNGPTHRIYIFPTPIVGTPIQLDVRGDKPLVPAQVAIEVGGEFPGWSRDGRYLHFSLGRSFFLYDVAEAMKARADSMKQAWPRTLAGDTLPVPGADTLPLRPAYQPRRFDIKVAAAGNKPSGVAVLRGARVITMKGGGNEVIERGDIVVTDNRITAVGASGTVTIPTGAQIFDVTGKTIVPGWVDVHAHTWPAADVHKTAQTSFYSNLAFGVTTMRDPQTNSSDVITYGDRLRTGDLLGPRLFATGQGVFAGDEVNTLQRAREVVRRYAEFYGTQTLKEYVAGNRRTRQLIVTATHEMGMSPTTEGAGDLKMSITEMLDGYAGHEHAYEIYPLYKDFALLSAASGITYTPTLLVNYGGVESKHYLIARDNAYNEPRLRRFTWQPDLARRTRVAVWTPEDDFIFKGVSGSAATIVKHGGLVGVGAHHEVQGMGTPWELMLMATGGMPVHDVLRVGTIFGAISIGLDRDLGSVEVGKLADLIVLDANPLQDISNVKRVKYVMRNGQLFDSMTLDELWPKPQKRASPWWLDWLPPASMSRPN
jgi:Tol biopolymer transport system component